MLYKTILSVKRRRNKCKDFTEQHFSCNYVITNALQYLLFYVVKVPVLHSKTGTFALQYRRFYNAKAILLFLACAFFTKQKRLICCFEGRDRLPIYPILPKLLPYAKTAKVFSMYHLQHYPRPQSWLYGQ